jgi:2-polyprenyl-3-methyl-5-hydroxy-6-metoxy-1,4-benzoquinol methylase
VLLDPTSCTYSAPLATFAVQLAATMPALLAAYRTGDGVAMTAFGDDLIAAQGEFNRPAFANTMAYWFSELPELAELLRRPGARVADVACGVGWSAIYLARNFPTLHVDGFDNDEFSVQRARRNAGDAGVTDRVQFQLADAAAIPGAGYDLVTMFEAIHDLAHPVAALRRAKELLTPGGTVLVADERVADTFTAPGDMTERLFYGASLLFCLPTGMAGADSTGTGAVFRTSTLRAYAAQAGFTAIDVATIESPLWRFYLLRAAEEDVEERPAFPA